MEFKRTKSYFVSSLLLGRTCAAYALVENFPFDQVCIHLCTYSSTLYRSEQPSLPLGLCSDGGYIYIYIYVLCNLEIN